MSLTIDSDTDRLDGAPPASFTAYTVMGWAYIVSDIAGENNVIAGLVTAGGADAPMYLNWDNDGDGNPGQMAIGSFVAPSSNNAALFASRPAVGAWFHWYVRCSGTGAGQLEAGWASTTADYVTQSTTIGTGGGALTPDHFNFGQANDPALSSRSRHSQLRVWNAVLTNDEIALERFSSDAVRTSNLVFDCPADHSAVAAALQDYSGNAEDLIQTTVSVSDNPPTFDLLEGDTSSWLFSVTTQTVINTGIASVEAFGSHTVSPGAVTIVAGSIASLEAFGTLKLNPKITATGIASLEAFGGHTLTPGDVIIAPNGIVSLEAFGGHTLLPGDVSILPSGIASAEAFGTVKLNFEIVCTGIVSLEAFGDHTLLPGDVSILPSGIASAEAFGDHTLSQDDAFVRPSGIATLEIFGSHTILAGEVTISPSGIASAEAFGAAKLNLEIVVTGIASLEAFGSHTLLPGDVSISPSGIASLEAFGSHTVINQGALVVTGIASAEAFGTAVLDQEYSSGHTIDGENEKLINTPYGSLTLYSNGAGDFYSI